MGEGSTERKTIPSDKKNKKEADEPTAGKKEKAQDAITELVKLVVYSVLIALGFRTVFFEPFNIPSESMLPTLMVGDYLFVSKYAYGYSRHSLPASIDLFDGRILEGDVERGDIIVFKLPRDRRTDYIKRVIGLPGDSLQMRDGVLYINGAAVQRERVGDFSFRETPNNECRGWPQYREIRDGQAWCNYPQYRETLPNGISYLTLDLEPNGRFDNTRLHRVPDGHYFMMGDNRDNSQDSRRPMSTGVGYVPAVNLVGRAEILFYSTNGKARLWEPWYWPVTVRWDRMFTLLDD